MYAEYMDGGTSVSDSDFEDYITYALAGKTYTTGRSLSTLYSLILEGGGVAGISGINIIYGTGHLWTVDGAWEKGYTVYQVSDHMIFDDPNQIVREKYSEKLTKLLHHNWGWGGNCNGYFLSTVADPSDAKTYDNLDADNNTYWSCTLVGYFYHFK